MTTACQRKVGQEHTHRASHDIPRHGAHCAISVFDSGEIRLHEVQ
ncbi:hypothetical protein [Candidatus Symbiopectobacterium sp. 'North America']|nr:hypothetical protein [Candidatus Symbiopectobacterium sp. 'North America']